MPPKPVSIPRRQISAVSRTSFPRSRNRRIRFAARPQRRAATSSSRKSFASCSDSCSPPRDDISRKRSQNFEKNLAEAVEVEQGFTAKVAAQEEAVREATHHARFVEETLAEIRRRHADNALERDRAEREHRYQAEQIVSLNNRAEVVRGEIDAIEQRLKLIESELERLHREDQAESRRSGCVAAHPARSREAISA